MEDMKGTGFFISWPRKPCYRTSVLLVVTTTHSMLHSTFITWKDSIRWCWRNFSMAHSCATPQASTTQLGRTCSYKQHTCGWGMHGSTRAIGVAIDYHQMVKWALSFAISGEVSHSVRSLSNTEQVSHHTRHMEEAEGRIKTDQADHRSLRDTYDVCVDPLD